MSGETGHLQRLTDQQVASRLKAYGNQGEFETSLHWLWDEAGKLLEEACRRQFGDEGTKVVHAYMTRPVDTAWVHTVAKHGRLMFAGKNSVPEFIAARACMAQDVLASFEEHFAGRPEDRGERTALLVDRFVQLPAAVSSAIMKRRKGVDEYSTW